MLKMLSITYLSFLVFDLYVFHFSIFDEIKVELNVASNIYIWEVAKRFHALSQPIARIISLSIQNLK